jgi:hypothetical protein
MCSSTMADKLGLGYWFALQAVRMVAHSSFDNYLQLLLQDRPDLYYCHKCTSIHRADGNLHPLPKKYNLLRFEIPQISFGHGTAYDLEFHHFQEAMARDRWKGSPGGRLDGFHYICKRYAEHRAIKLLEIEARSDSDHLLLRTQHMVQYQTVLGSKPNETLEFLSKNIICSHDFSWRTAVGPLGHGQTYLCPRCPTEAILERFELTTGKGVMCITQWMDFGPVTSPKDPAWLVHLAIRKTYDPNFYYFTPYQWMRSYGLSGIKDRFENQPGVTFDELKAANLARFLAQFPKLKDDGLGRNGICAMLRRVLLRL